MAHSPILIENKDTKCSNVQKYLASEFTFSAFDSVKLFEYGRFLKFKNFLNLLDLKKMI